MEADLVKLTLDVEHLGSLTVWVPKDSVLNEWNSLSPMKAAQAVVDALAYERNHAAK